VIAVDLAKEHRLTSWQGWWREPMALPSVCLGPLTCREFDDALANLAWFSLHPNRQMSFNRTVGSDNFQYDAWFYMCCRIATLACRTLQQVTGSWIVTTCCLFFSGKMSHFTWQITCQRTKAWTVMRCLQSVCDLTKRKIWTLQVWAMHYGIAYVKTRNMNYTWGLLRCCGHNTVHCCSGHDTHNLYFSKLPLNQKSAHQRPVLLGSSVTIIRCQG